MTATSETPLDVPPLAPPAPPGRFQRFARNAVHDRLRKLRSGRLTIEDSWSGACATYGAGESVRPATLTVHHPEFYTGLVARGSLGAAESYISGSWTADDLPAVIRTLIRDRDVLEAVDGGFARLSRPLLQLFHARNRNTRAGSSRNIAAHYDLGNEFFEQLLDPTLSYSSAVFESDYASLEDGQVAKIDRLCRRLDLKPTDHLVEIGTGWGGLAIHAAREYGCRVTTTTISEQQHAVAAKRIRKAGLEDRIDLRLQDYRDLTGRYDKLVSCEMIEAVGHQYLPTFVSRCADLLKPDGVMALQAILISDQHYAHCVRQVDFIKRYVFPGCFIPSTTAIVDATTKHTDLRLTTLESFGTHYARTLREWRDNLLSRRDTIRRLGYGEQFLRTWDYYLAYCEGGFAERFLDVGHFVFTKPQARPRVLVAERDGIHSRATEAALLGDS